MKNQFKLNGGLKTILKRVEPQDIRLVNSWHEIDEIKYLVFNSLNSIKIDSIIELPEHFFIILEKKDLLPIGYLQLRNYDIWNEYGIFDIVIANNNFRNRGYGFDATFVFLNYVFNDLSINKINIYIHGFNSKTIRAAGKFGFKQEGVLIERILRKDKYYDVYIFSLLKKEYNNLINIDRYKRRIKEMSIER